jgi:hypothetical protein
MLFKRKLVCRRFGIRRKTLADINAVDWGFWTMRENFMMQSACRGHRKAGPGYGEIKGEMMRIQPGDNCFCCKGFNGVKAIPIRLTIWGRTYDSFAAICKKCRREKSQAEIARLAQNRVDLMFGKAER